MTQLGKPLPPPLPPRTWAAFALVTLGLGLNLRASVLLGPHLHDRFRVPQGWYFALVALPVLMGALARLPVGVLTDRYGVRVMLPAVSLVGAVSAAGLGWSGSLPVAVAFGVLAGVAGAAFVVGATLVTNASPYGWRGRTLGVFGLGAGIAALLSVLSWWFDPGAQVAPAALAALLTVFAGVAALVLRDPAPARPSGSLLRTCRTMIRLASTSSVTLLYLLALGGILSAAVFLPVYLTRTLAVTWFTALVITIAVVTLATIARVAGGWRTDRRPTTPLLMVCYTIAAALCVVLAIGPRSWITVPAVAGIAVCDGLASGALLALIGKAARPGSAGTVLGVTGAAGTLGTLLPLLLFGGLHRLTHSYTISWALLAALLVAAALYVHTRGLYIGLGLAVEYEPEPSPTALTVAALAAEDTRLGAAAVVASLAELAISDELVMVYGIDDRPRAGLSPEALAAGLRDRLPRHSVVVVRITGRPETLGRDALLLVEHVDAGALAIAVTPAATLHEVAADLSIYLQADRVLAVSYHPAAGTDLQPVKN